MKIFAWVKAAVRHNWTMPCFHNKPNISCLPANKWPMSFNKNKNKDPFLKIAHSLFFRKNKSINSFWIHHHPQLCQHAKITISWVYKQIANSLCNREPGQIFSTLKYQGRPELSLFMNELGIQWTRKQLCLNNLN